MAETSWSVEDFDEETDAAPEAYAGLEDASCVGEEEEEHGSQ